MPASAAWGGGAAGAAERAVAGGVLAEALSPGGALVPEGAPSVDATAAPARPATAAAAVAPLRGDGGELADDGRGLPVDAVDAEACGPGDAVLVLSLAPGVAEAFAGVAGAGRCFGAAPSAVPVEPAALGGEVVRAVVASAGGDAKADAARGGGLAGLGGDAVPALSPVAAELVGVVVAGRCFGAAPSAVVVGRADVPDVVDAPVKGDEGVEVADMLLRARAGLGGGAALVLSLALVATEVFVGVAAAGRCCGAAPSAVVVTRAAPGGDVLDDADASAGGDGGADAADTLLGGSTGGREAGGGDTSLEGEEARGVSCPAGRGDRVSGAGAACVTVSMFAACSDDGRTGVGDAASAGREEAAGPRLTIGRVTVRRCTSFRSQSSAAASFSTVSSFGSGSVCWNMYVMCCRLQPDRAARSTFDIFFASRH